jgi:tRNA (guanine-N7-)-methyltransferase
VIHPKLSIQTLPWPADWPTLFGADRPLILEIGFGRGAFLLHLARTRPGCNILGLEINNRCLTAAEAAMERERLTNVRVVASMAESALHHLIRPGSLAEVHINFPDPWFKTAHHHRRLMQRDTLDLLLDRMQPGAALYLATDIREYADMAAALFAATPGLINRFPTPWVPELPERGIVTKYEARARREGRPCHYFALTRTLDAQPTFPVIGDLRMAHIVLTTPLTLDEIQTRFGALQTERDGAHVHVMGIYRGRSSLLFETHIHETTIDQRVALLLAERGTTDIGPRYTIQLSALGHPRVTTGVHVAVAALGDAVLKLDARGRAISVRSRPDDEED